MSRVAFVVYSPSAKPFERFLFDVSSFPSVPPSETLTPFEDALPGNDENGADGPSTTSTNIVDLEEQFRGVMGKLAYCGSSLGQLPEGCSFTVCIELKEKAEPPIGVSYCSCRPTCPHGYLPWSLLASTALDTIAAQSTASNREH